MTVEAVKGVFDKALEAMGGEIHVLVNCAGIRRRAPAVEFSESDWDDVRGSSYYFSGSLFRSSLLFFLSLFFVEVSFSIFFVGICGCGGL